MQKLIPYLQLCRVANVFTALADIFLGFLLTHASLQPAVSFSLLLAASALLYMSGMVFNDVFDRDVDLRERPERPIPSGRISLRTAIVLGACLMLGGVVSAGAAGLQSLLVAGLLVVCILGYDGLLKSTVFGPSMMGACRLLNVMLGASAAAMPGGEMATAAGVWRLPQLHVAVGLGVYIVGVTWFARHETGRSPRAQLAGALGIVNLGLALLIAFAFNWPGADFEPRRMKSVLVLVLIAATINRRLAAAIFDPVPAKVQLSIKTMLFSLVMIDSTLVYFFQPDTTYAFYVIALLIPAFGLSRVLAVT